MNIQKKINNKLYFIKKRLIPRRFNGYPRHNRLGDCLLDGAQVVETLWEVTLAQLNPRELHLEQVHRENFRSLI